MNKTKLQAFLFLVSISIAIAGCLNYNRIITNEIAFYKSPITDFITIDSISLISGGSEVEVIYAIIGYGRLESSKNKLGVDMTEGLDINSFSYGEAYSFVGKKYPIYRNQEFEYGRLKTSEIAEIKFKNKIDLLLWAICFLPLIVLIFYWIKKRKN